MLLAFKDGEWKEIKAFPRMYNGESWEMVDGFVHPDDRWVHAWYNILGTVDVPELSGTYEYNKEEQTVTISPYDHDYIEVSGDTSATEAGTYTVRFHLLNYHYTWSDGTSADKLATWTIDKRHLLKPTVTETYIYNKTTQTVTINNYDSNYEVKTGTEQAKDVGLYHLYFNLKDPVNTVWEDGSITQLEVDWSIQKGRLPKPVLKPGDTGSYVFAQQDVKISDHINNYNVNYINATGDLQAYNVGSYTARYDLIDDVNTVWEDGSVSQVTIEWSITKMVLEIPRITKPTVSNPYTFNGATQTAELSSAYDETWMLITADSEVSAINAGNHAIYIKLKDTNNTAWADGSVSQQQLSWTINKLALTVPSISGTKSWTFDNASHTVTVANYDASYITEKDYPTARTKTSSGTYSIYWNLKDTLNTVWSDNTTYQKSDDWTIAKREIADPSLNTTEFVYDGNPHKPTPTYNSTYVEISGDTGYKTANGTYTITFTLKYSNDTYWHSGGSSPKNITWTIGRLGVDVPTMGTDTFTFDNANHTPPTTYNSTYVTEIKTTERSSGTYTVTWELKNPEDTQWKGGGNSPKTKTWKINKRRLTNAPAITTSGLPYTYDNTNHSVETNVSSNTADAELKAYVTEGGDAKTQKNANTYTITWDLKWPDDTTWSSGGNSQKTASWAINKMSLTVPSLTQTWFLFTNANINTANYLRNYDSTYEQIDSSSSYNKKNAGSYTTVIQLKDTDNTQWNNGSTSDISLNWTIGKYGIPYYVNQTGAHESTMRHNDGVVGVEGEDGTNNIYLRKQYSVTWGVYSNAGTYGLYNSDIVVTCKAYLNGVEQSADFANIAFTYFAEQNTGLFGARFIVHSLNTQQLSRVQLRFTVAINMPSSMVGNVDCDNGELSRSWQYVAYPMSS